MKAGENAALPMPSSPFAYGPGAGIKRSPSSWRNFRRKRRHARIVPACDHGVRRPRDCQVAITHPHLVAHGGFGENFRARDESGQHHARRSPVMRSTSVICATASLSPRTVALSATKARRSGRDSHGDLNGDVDTHAICGALRQIILTRARDRNRNSHYGHRRRAPVRRLNRTRVRRTKGGEERGLALEIFCSCSRAQAQCGESPWALIPAECRRGDQSANARVPLSCFRSSTTERLPRLYAEKQRAFGIFLVCKKGDAALGLRPRSIFDFAPNPPVSVRVFAFRHHSITRIPSSIRRGCARHKWSSG